MKIPRMGLSYTGKILTLFLDGAREEALTGWSPHFILGPAKVASSDPEGNFHPQCWGCEDAQGHNRGSCPAFWLFCLEKPPQVYRLGPVRPTQRTSMNFHPFFPSPTHEMWATKLARHPHLYWGGLSVWGQARRSAPWGSSLGLLCQFACGLLGGKLGFISLRHVHFTAQI